MPRRLYVVRSADTRADLPPALARKLLMEGIDPGRQRREQREKTIQERETFELVAREWFKKFQPTWAQSHATRTISRLTRDVFPYIGHKPISQIKPTDVLSVLRRLESRSILATAHRVKHICGQVFRYAVATGRAERDPSADLKGVMPPAKTKHMAALTEPAKVGELLRAIDAFKGTFIVECALKLAPFVFVRPGELRKAEWSEMHFEDALWSIPAEKMKMREPHIVPLATQAVDILKSIKPLTGHLQYVFPNERSDKRPMSDVALLAALRRLGYTNEEMTVHGFRAIARTLLDEILHERIDLIEHQLGHTVRDPLGRAYNRTKHLPERIAMMQRWADYLDSLKKEVKVLPFRTAV